jgi:hypothetical protein
MKHLTVFAAALLVAATTSAAPARADEYSDQ